MLNNPIMEKYSGKYGEIPFKSISIEHYMPAIDSGLEEAYNSIELIKGNNAEANFSNTIEALELSSYNLDRATSVYFNIYALNSDPDFKALAEEISPKLAKYSGDIYTDTDLFNKVKYVYDKRDTLSFTVEELRLLENTYINFTRNGALLNPEQKIKLQKIDEELSILSPQFSKNNLEATNAYEKYITDENQIKGIPINALSAAKQKAKDKGYNSGWIFNLQMPSYLPVIQYAENRELREELSTAYGVKNLDGKYDNRDIILKTIRLKKERANILGYLTHAHYTLEKRMAGKPEIVLDFLDKIHAIAFPAAKVELKELKNLAKELDNIDDFQTWDFNYYSQKLKKSKFNFDPEELRPYFKSENVIDGIFKVANKMYGLNFKFLENIDKYHDDVKVYKVIDHDQSYVGLLYIDLYPRDTKQGGAWMNTFQTQGLQNGEIKRPHVLISGNLTPSTNETPSLLSLDEVRTIFHEFGHALHGLLSDVKYCSLASPNVFWDFVELPSQIMENWLLEAETLNLFAKHYKTDGLIPHDFIDKIKKSQTFNAGSMNNRQLSLGYLDMAWHMTDPDLIENVESFENSIMEKTRLLPKTTGNTSSGFSHIFAGGYSSGYYSYKWAEILDADAFELFKEKGIFNRNIAKSFRENILSKGNTVEPMKLYKLFRGSEPDTDALLKRDGLIE